MNVNFTHLYCGATRFPEPEKFFYQGNIHKINKKATEILKKDIVFKRASIPKKRIEELLKDAEGIIEYIGESIIRNRKVDDRYDINFKNIITNLKSRSKKPKTDYSEQITNLTQRYESLKACIKY